MSCCGPRHSGGSVARHDQALGYTTGGGDDVGGLQILLVVVVGGVGGACIIGIGGASAITGSGARVGFDLVMGGWERVLGKNEMNIFLFFFSFI